MLSLTVSLGFFPHSAWAATRNADHIPQVPMPAYRVPVGSVTEAARLLSILADYDRFQLQHRVKGEYSSVRGLEVYDAGDPLGPWVEWYSTKGGDLVEHMRIGDEIETLVWSEQASVLGPLVTVRGVVVRWQS